MLGLVVGLLNVYSETADAKHIKVSDHDSDLKKLITKI